MAITTERRVWQIPKRGGRGPTQQDYADAEKNNCPEIQETDRVQVGTLFVEINVFQEYTTDNSIIIDPPTDPIFNLDLSGGNSLVVRWPFSKEQTINLNGNQTIGQKLKFILKNSDAQTRAIVLGDGFANPGPLPIASTKRGYVSFESDGELMLLVASNLDQGIK